jgi:sulfonate dioxygenase
MSKITTTIETTASNTTPTTNLKIHSSCVPNPDFVPPDDFKFLSTLQEVPIKPKEPTEIPIKALGDYTKEEYKYKDFLPYSTLTSEPTLSPYEHFDVASRADPAKKSLFEAIPSRKDMTPNIGTEVRGIQLSQLTAQQRDKLALYVAERGLVVFRDQDFVDQSIEWLQEFGSYFGRLHGHHQGPHAKDHPELDIVYRDRGEAHAADTQVEGGLNTVAWHNDM